MYSHSCSEYGCDRPELHGDGASFGGLFSSIAHVVSSGVSTVSHAAVSVASGTANLVSNAAKVAGREIDKAAHSVQDAAGKVSSLVAKVPIVGAPLHTVFDAAWHVAMAPVNAVVDVAIRGKRIDKVALDGLTTALHDVKAQAPYAQMVVSMVPGIGSGVSAAIGAGTALMNGQPIDKALAEGVLSAVPGGPLGKSLANVGFSTITSVAKGEPINIETIAKSAAGSVINNLPIPEGSKQALRMCLVSAAAVAHGQNPVMSPEVLDAAFREATKMLPSDATKALQTGLAMGTAVVKQGERVVQLAGPTVNKLIESGIQLAHTLPTVDAARKLAGAGTRGFDLAQGLLQQKASTFDIAHYRATLQGEDLKGFDMALAAKIGMVSHPPHPSLSPAARAGHAITLGMQGAPPTNKAAIMTAVGAHPSASVGAKLAVAQVAANRENFLVRLLHAIGISLGHAHPPASHA